MKQYTFEVPFSGMMRVWLDAENRDEAFEKLNNGDWEESQEIAFESIPERGVLISSEDK